MTDLLANRDKHIACKCVSCSYRLSVIDRETIADIAEGLTDKAMAARRQISVRGVQNRLSNLLTRFGVGEKGGEHNPRMRIVYTALRLGIISINPTGKLCDPIS